MKLVIVIHMTKLTVLFAAKDKFRLIIIVKINCYFSKVDVKRN